MAANVENPVVLVTGASGDLGRRLLAKLWKRPWYVRALEHKTMVEGADETIRGDLEDAPSLARALEGAEAAIHLAGITHSRDPRRYDRVNTGGTAAVLAAAEAADVKRLVHISTRAISPEGGAYGKSKVRAEELVRESRLAFVILRLAEVYGGTTTEGVNRIIRASRSNSFVPVIGRGRDMLCPIHIEDAVDAMIGALERPEAVGKTYTVGGPCLPLAEFVDECRRALGGGRRVHVPVSAARAAAFAARALPLPLYPDQLDRLQSPKERPTATAERDLGFRVRPLREGLRVAQ